MSRYAMPERAHVAEDTNTYDDGLPSSCKRCWKKLNQRMDEQGEHDWSMNVKASQ